MNSLRHGFAASRIVLSDEERPHFNELHAHYIEKFQPADEVEANLVDQMVAAVWRQYRLWAGEASLFDLKILQQHLEASSQFPDIDSSGRFALAFKALADESNSLRLMQRYETNCRYQYERALRNLLELRKPSEPNAISEQRMEADTRPSHKPRERFRENNLDLSTLNRQKPIDVPDPAECQEAL